MSTFHGGPADGISLSFQRGPLYLRVVQGPTRFDVLDMPDDDPAEGEWIHVYRRRGDSIRAHINARGSKMRSGFYEFADYEYVELDPETCERLRDRDAWQGWNAVRQLQDERRSP